MPGDGSRSMRSSSATSRSGSRLGHTWKPRQPWFTPHSRWPRSAATRASLVVPLGVETTVVVSQSGADFGHPLLEERLPARALRVPLEEHRAVAAPSPSAGPRRPGSTRPGRASSRPRWLKNTLSGWVIDTGSAAGVDHDLLGHAPSVPEARRCWPGGAARRADCPMAARRPVLMATSLRDIPGANRARKRRKAERGLWAPPRPTTLDLTPGGLPLERTKAPRRYNQPARQARPLPDPPRASAPSRWACGSSRPSGAPPASTSRAPGSTTVGRSPPTPPRSSTSASRLNSSDELFRSDLQGRRRERARGHRAGGRRPHAAHPARRAGGERARGAGPRRGRAPHRAVGRPHVPRRRHLHAGATSSTASPPRSTCRPACRPCRSTSRSRSRARSRRAWSCASTTSPIDNDDGSFAVDFDSPPTGSLAFEAIDEAGNRTLKHVVVPVAYPETTPRRARERGGVGRRRAARRHRGPDRPRPDRHRRARPQGRVRDRRLRLRAGQGQGDRRRHRRLRPLRDRRVPRGQGHPGDRAAGRVPRPDLRQRRVGGRRSRPGRPDAVRRDVLHLRRLHELRPRGGPGLQPGHRPRGRVDGREGHPLGLHPPSRGRPGHDGDPRAAGLELRRRSPRSSPRCSASCAHAARTRARRCSASRPRPATASPRTCRRWERSSTTWRRWSTRRTGVPACTASTTRSGSPTTS